MSAVAPLPRPWGVEEFLAWERNQPESHEFISGRIYAMTAPRFEHGRRVNRIAGALREQLPAGCEVFTEAYVLRAAGDATKPDIMVLCHELPGDATEADDAELLVEVLSPSNRPGEMAAKLESYLTLPSLKAYLIVDGDAYEAWTRVGQDGPWQREEVEAGEFTVMLHGREVRL